MIVADTNVISEPPAILPEPAGARVLDFDQSAAMQYAHLRASRESKGLTISVEDNMIAAICLSSRCNLATRNVKDFEDAGIRIHDPWDGD